MSAACDNPRIRRVLFQQECLGAVAALAVACLLALAPGARAHETAAAPPQVSPELEAVRAKLEKYRDPVKAVHDGYLSTLGCVQYPDGGMGVHFLNLGTMGPEPDPWSPQILMYEPVGGKLRLVAVEWLVPLATGVKERPKLFGREFHGPMEGHHPLMPRELHHYDLHVWLFKENPEGLFNNTNPDVNCTGKWPYVMNEKPPKMVTAE